MDKNPFTPGLIAPCGMNCGVCKAYLRTKNPCTGCRAGDRDKPKTILACKMRTCDRRKDAFCGGCGGFPCDRLKHMDKRYREKYGMSELENLKRIEEQGLERFVEIEKEKWISGQGVFCVHDQQYYEARDEDASETRKRNPGKKR